MTFLMASLKRTKSGALIARKSIPQDIRSEYQRLYGQGWEARLSVEAGTPGPHAKALLGEWLAEIESRIYALRAASKGEGQFLTQKQALGLAGEWYRWFVGRHEESPGESETWQAKSFQF